MFVVAGWQDLVISGHIEDKRSAYHPMPSASYKIYIGGRLRAGQVDWVHTKTRSCDFGYSKPCRPASETSTSSSYDSVQATVFKQRHPRTHALVIISYTASYYGRVAEA